jgi:hypothetical protein
MQKPLREDFALTRHIHIARGIRDSLFTFLTLHSKENPSL